MILGLDEKVLLITGEKPLLELISVCALFKSKAVASNQNRVEFLDPETGASTEKQALEGQFL